MNINYPAVYRTEGLIQSMILQVRDSFNWPIKVFNYSLVHLGSGEEPIPLVVRTQLMINIDVFGIVENSETFDDLPILSIFNIAKAFFTLNQCQTVELLRPDLVVQRMVIEYLDHNKVWICPLYGIDIRNMQLFIDYLREIIESQYGGEYDIHEEFIWADAFEHCRFCLSHMLHIPVEEIQDGFICYITYKDDMPRKRRLKLTKNNARNVMYSLQSVSHFYWYERNFNSKKFTITAFKFRGRIPIL